MATVAAEPIVALDVESASSAFALVRQLGDTCGFYKVGQELFTAAGPDVVRGLRELGHRVFLDLKFHDIPTTVRGAMRSARALGATLATVHGSGGSAMLAAAVEGGGTECGVLAVTILTSLDRVALAEAWGRPVIDIGAEVARLAIVAASSGAHGVVCSGHEANVVRAALGDRLATLVPGIRFAEEAAHDQSRVTTPAAAAAAGARYLVLGRAVTHAVDPAAAMRRVHHELGRA